MVLTVRNVSAEIAGWQFFVVKVNKLMSYKRTPIVLKVVVYLGEVGKRETFNTDSWVTWVDAGSLDTQHVWFKLNTGGAPNVWGPQNVRGVLLNTNRRLFGPGYTLLKCLVLFF